MSVGSLVHRYFPCLGPLQRDVSGCVTAGWLEWNRNKILKSQTGLWSSLVLQEKKAAPAAAARYPTLPFLALDLTFHFWDRLKNLWKGKKLPPWVNIL